MTKLNLRPIGDRVLVQKIEEESKSPGGIIIPDSAKEKPMTGKVMAVGVARNEKGEIQAPAVKVGDIVVFAKWAGTEIKHGGQDYLIMKAEDLLAVFE